MLPVSKPQSLEREVRNNAGSATPWLTKNTAPLFLSRHDLSMHTRRSFCIAGTTISVLTLQPGSALARRHNHGEYVILRARYGTAARSIDVTEQLKALARRDRRIRITNEIFGRDPARGHVKVLEIYARAEGGPTRVFEYREKEFVDTALFDAWSTRESEHVTDGPGAADQGQATLFILRARYGRGGQARDVTGLVRRMVRGGRLDMVIENNLFDVDPIPGTRKYLTLDYSVDGTRRQVHVAEHDRLILP